MKNSEKLFRHFQPVSKEAWMARIEKDLKGKSPTEFEADMGGVRMEAFYHPDDIPVSRGSLKRKTAWEIGEDFLVGNDLKKTNRQVLQALAMGINAPRFVCETNLSLKDLETLLEGIHLQMIAVYFQMDNQDADLLSLFSLLAAYQKSKQIDPQACKTSFNCPNHKPNPEAIRKILLQLKKEDLPVKVLTVNGQKHFDEAKTTDELAHIILDGIDWIDTYAGDALSPSFLQQHIQFSILIGKNFFLQIAKIRALRLLWANVLKAWDVNPAFEPVLEAHFAPGLQSDDPNSNRVAATTQAMSAIIGGVDRLTVLPADSGNPSGGTEFSRRIARNVQHILQLESHLDRVADPAAGSYYVEELTRKLAEEAWRIIGGG